MSHTPLFSWADCAPRLVTVAAGRAAADLVICGGTLVNVQSREVLPGWQVPVDAQGEFAQIALVERHRATGQVVNAFVSSFGYCGRMAIASTVAHDCHHLIVVGTDREQMALAADPLAEVGGGVTLWRDGQELALVELPIAGLMSDRRVRWLTRHRR